VLTRYDHGLIDGTEYQREKCHPNYYAVPDLLEITSVGRVINLSGDFVNPRKRMENDQIFLSLSQTL
jgi:hypothetical protein